MSPRTHGDEPRPSSAGVGEPPGSLCDAEWWDELDELDATGVLRSTESTLRVRRAAEVDDLRLALRWADLHASDPLAHPDPDREVRGGPRLVELDGDGTPEVQDLALCELAIARRTHVLSTRAVVADALDLRHRLPRTWRVVLAGECEPWLARRCAAMSRRLSSAQVAVVDAALARAIAGEQPSRVLAICEAKVIEADPTSHAERVAEQLRRRGVWLTRTEKDLDGVPTGLRTVIARVEVADAVWVDALVDHVADLLAADPTLRREHHADLPDEPGRDELRSVAFGWLARPAELADLLAGQHVRHGATADPETALPAPRRGRRRTPTRAVLHMHVARRSVEGMDGVARVEGVGPALLSQVARWLGRTDGVGITLTPVLDLAEESSVNAYEHPVAVRRRVHLRNPGEVFPHGSVVGVGPDALDVDHPAPFRSAGPPGQTGDHQAAPLGRTAHRAKTHLAHRLTQTGLTSYAWTSPHGLRRDVGPTGTHDRPDPDDPDGLDELPAGPDDPALAAALDRIFRSHTRDRT